MPPPVTLRDIAKKARVSHATVSLALRDAPKISLAVRRRIHALAAELGYKKNPALSAWMRCQRLQGQAALGETIAYLNPFPDANSWLDIPSITRFHAGAKARAIELGYSWDEIWHCREGMSHERLNDVLAARGVRGVIVGSSKEPETHLRLDWPRIAAIAQGMTLVRPELPRVCNNYYATAATLLRHLIDDGYRKIGLFLFDNTNLRCDKMWVASCLVHRPETAECIQIPPCIGTFGDDGCFKQWFLEHRPDVVVTCESQSRGWLLELGLKIPEDVGFASLDWDQEERWKGVSGMDHQLELCGAAAIDFLAGRLERNQTGLSTLPETIMIPATWVQGTSTQTRTAKSRKMQGPAKRRAPSTAA